MPRLPPAILLMGPTASGKTAAAIHLAGTLPVDIVSVDSAQVYRGMDIGTAKPDAATLARAPHALIDILEPTESYSAARFRADALAVMAESTAQGRIPLLVGGTMLYFRALLSGLSDLPGADAQLRAQLDGEAAALGWPALHERLARIDPDMATRLAPTDAQRIQRALEIHALTGAMPSQRRVGGEPPPYDFLLVGLVPAQREMLHQRIAERFDAMLAGGLVDELIRLRSAHALHAELPSMRSVGYRQAWHYLEGSYGLEELRNRGIYATRQLAKRQLTWLRSMAAVTTLDCLEADLPSKVELVARRWLAERV